MIEFLLLRCRRPIVVALHILIVVAAYYLAFVLRFDGAIDKSDFQVFMKTLPLVAATQLILFIPFRLYRGLWRYIGIQDLQNIILATVISALASYALIQGFLQVRGYPRSIYIIDSLLVTVLLGGVRLVRRLYHELGSLRDGRRVLLIGAGDAAEMIVRDMRNNPFYNIEPIGFVDDDRSKVGRMIHNVPVLGTRNNLPEIIERYSPDEILVAICRAEPQLLRSIVRNLESYRLPIRTLPNLRDLINGSVAVGQIRNVSLDDLLQRGPVGLDPAPLRRLVEGRRVMVTGAGGSIGSELCRQLNNLNAELLVLFEHYENALYTIEADLHGHGTRCELAPVIGDVTDEARVRAVFDEYRPEIILHAAAHKHVPLMEQNPCEAVKNNIRGTRIAAEAADRYGAERFVLISTDKAVQPSSIMGATKRAAEFVVRHQSRRSSTCFAMVRFGNVLGSNGSVIPKFLEQINAGGPVTVTHPDVKRFFMTIPEAVNLVLHAATLNNTGAIYGLDMGTPIKIYDMARHLIRLSGLIPDDEIQIEFTGLRPGEKLNEQLLDDMEEAQPSGIAQIFKVASPPLQNSEQQYRELKRLEAVAARGATEEVTAALARFVPGFRHNAGDSDQAHPVATRARLSVNISPVKGERAEPVRS
jgi:FlaA1/EpsC-like NDP-sugar epimerase